MKATATPVCLLALICLSCLSCATSIPVIVDHPPEIDTSAIDCIAVQPFSQNGVRVMHISTDIPDLSPGSAFMEPEIGNIVSDSIAQILRRSRGFTVVDPINPLSSGSSIPDARITGKILDYTVIEGFKKLVRTEEDGSTTTFWRTTKELRLSFSYSLVEAASGRVVDTLFKEGSAIAESDSFVPARKTIDEKSLARRIMEKLARGIERELMPWNETVYLAFETKDNDSDYKAAEGLVRNRDYLNAYDIYMYRWRSKGDFRAGFNAALLLFGMNRKQEAIRQMKEIADKYGFARAKEQYRWMLDAYKDERKVKDAGYLP